MRQLDFHHQERGYGGQGLKERSEASNFSGAKMETFSMVREGQWLLPYSRI